MRIVGVNQSRLRVNSSSFSIRYYMMGGRSRGLPENIMYHTTGNGEGGQCRDDVCVVYSLANQAPSRGRLPFITKIILKKFYYLCNT